MSSDDDNTDHTLPQQLEQLGLQNSAGTELPQIPTSEFLRSLIDHISECRDLAVGRAMNIPIRACIEYVLRNTGPSGYKELQYDFVRAVAMVLLNAGRLDGSQVRRPRHGQIESIRRVVYRLGDTILIARTGYGKSIVLQAVSVIMEGRTTIQLIPLSRLGEDQLDSIASIPGTRPVLISDQTVKVKAPKSILTILFAKSCIRIWTCGVGWRTGSILTYCSARNKRSITASFGYFDLQRLTNDWLL